MQTSYIYAGSRLLSTETSSGTSYLTNDHLGSPRINTNASGTVTARHDYHPFGEEIPRTGYGSDTVRKQFTGYERDVETGLDFAQARYHSSDLGRFSSPDPLMASGRASSPQSWNRYSYVGNNPLVFTDPTGLSWFSQVQANGETIYRWYDEDPGEGWSRVSDFIYYVGGTTGYIALDPNSNNWNSFASSGQAMDSIRYSLATWHTNQLITGANDAINPANSYIRNAIGSIFGIDPNINEATDQYRGGWWTGVILNATAGFVAGAASGGPAAASTLDDIALAEANAAQAAGKTSGAAAALRVGDDVFANISGGPPTTNPVLRGIIDQVDNAPGYAGRCAEIRCIEQALDAGLDVTGATIRVVNIKRAGNPLHGTVKWACPACDAVQKHFGIKPQL